jgi:iron complex outermembrane receptor protein
VAALALGAGSGRLVRAEESSDEEQVSLEALLDIVVTATLRNQSAIDAPASITVIGAAEIRARGYRTLKAIMNDVPGFNDVSDTNEEIVGVRGLFSSTTNKILILINGHRMNDLMLGRYNTDQFLGMSAIERVEFIRGPASALYGTGALVGIVNIITKQGGEASEAEVKIQGGPTSREASLNWGKQLGGGYTAFFNFTFLDSPGQEIAQDARLDVAPPGQTPAAGRIYVGRYPLNLSALLTLRSENSSIALRAAHFQRVPPRASSGSLYDYQAEPFKPAYGENDFYADYSYRWAFGASRATKVTVNPSVHFFSYDEQSVFTFGANRVPPLGEHTGMQSEFVDSELKLTVEQPLGEGLDLIGGLDGLLAIFYRADAVRSAGDHLELIPGGYTPNGSWFLGGTFLQTVWSPAESFTLTVGARYDSFQKEAASQLTPRAGLVWKPAEVLALKLLYGRSYLAPMWAHRRSNDGYFIGNPALRPESFHGSDLVVAYGDKRATATVDFFADRMSGLITAVAPPGAADSNTLKYDNAGESVYLGVEASGEAQVRRGLRLQGSYSYLAPVPRWTSQSLRAGDRIKNVPQHTWRYGLRLDPTPSLSVSVWGRAYTAVRTNDPITMANTIPAVALFDASLSYSWRRFTFQLIGTNLTNRAYERGGTAVRPLAGERLDVEGALWMRF